MQTMVAVLLCLLDAPAGAAAWPVPISDAQLSDVSGSGLDTRVNFNRPGAIAIAISLRLEGRTENLAGVGNVLANSHRTSIGQAETSLSMNVQLNLFKGF